jgi:hypothetical protein
MVFFLYSFFPSHLAQSRPPSTSPPSFVPEKSKDRAGKSECPGEPRKGRVGRLPAITAMATMACCFPSRLSPSWSVYSDCVGCDLLCLSLTEALGVGQPDLRIRRSPSQELGAVRHSRPPVVCRGLHTGLHAVRVHADTPQRPSQSHRGGQFWPRVYRGSGANRCPKGRPTRPRLAPTLLFGAVG